MVRQREFGEGPLSRVTNVVYWLLVIGLFLSAALAPSLALSMALVPDVSNLPLYALAAVPVGPALAAAFFAWRRFLAGDEPHPWAHVWRGLRVNAVDALTAWLPGLLALLVLAMNIAHAEAAGIADGLTGVYLALALVAALWSVRMLSIVSAFAFRWRDSARLSFYTLVARPLPTLAIVSYGVLVAGIVYLTFDVVAVLLASMLTLGFTRSEQPVIELVAERFTAATE